MFSGSKAMVYLTEKVLEERVRKIIKVPSSSINGSSNNV